MLGSSSALHPQQFAPTELKVSLRSTARIGGTLSDWARNCNSSQWRQFREIYSSVDVGSSWNSDRGLVSFFAHALVRTHQGCSVVLRLANHATHGMAEETNDFSRF